MSYNSDKFYNDFSGKLVDKKIKTAAIKGGGVMIITQIAKFFLQLIATAILARLLAPSDFGIIAMVLVFTGFADLFKDLGLSHATIQKRIITPEQVTVLFFLNVSFGLFLYFLFIFIAPSIANIYADSRVELVVYFVASAFLFGGVEAQYRALVKRAMRFKLLAIIEISSILTSSIIAIYLAFNDFGYMSLAFQPAIKAIISMVCFILFTGWHPSLPKLNCEIGDMLHLAKNLTGFNIFNYLNRNVDNLIIGIFLGGAALGLYSKAYGLLMLPIQQINQPLTNVALPVLARLSNDTKQFRKYFLAALAIISFVIIPIQLYALIDAKNIILFILGDQWVDAIIIFKILAFGGILGALNIVPTWLCVPLNNSDRMFRWALISAPVLTVCFLFSVEWGLIGISITFSTVWGALSIILIIYSSKGTPVQSKEIFSSMLYPFICAVMSSFILLFKNIYYSNPSYLLNILTNSALFFCSYGLALMIFPKGRLMLRQLQRYYTLFKT